MKVTEEDRIEFANTCRKSNRCNSCGDVRMYLEEYYAQLGHNEELDTPIQALVYKCANCKHIELFILD